MGDNDTETMNNILHANWEFDAEAFENVSEEAKDFISTLLVPAKWYSSIYQYSTNAKSWSTEYTRSHAFHRTFFIIAMSSIIYPPTCLVALRASLFSSISQSFSHFDLLSFP